MRIQNDDQTPVEWHHRDGRKSASHPIDQLSENSIAGEQILHCHGRSSLHVVHELHGSLLHLSHIQHISGYRNAVADALSRPSEANSVALGMVLSEVQIRCSERPRIPHVTRCVQSPSVRTSSTIGCRVRPALRRFHRQFKALAFSSVVPQRRAFELLHRISHPTARTPSK